MKADVEWIDTKDAVPEEREIVLAVLHYGEDVSPADNMYLINQNEAGADDIEFDEYSTNAAWYHNGQFCWVGSYDTIKEDVVCWAKLPENPYGK